jgi:hypothetical protein
MDGVAVATAFTTAPGPDCLKEVVPKLGQRLKVYKAIKTLIEVSFEIAKQRTCSL